MTFAPYSYSKLSCFESCPMMFKLRYIDKAKPSENPQYFKRGLNIHRELENYPNCSPDFKESFSQRKIGVKYDSIMNGEVRHEVRLGLDENLNITSYYDKANVIKGIIDMIYIKDGVVHLVDWKTGKIPHELNWDQLAIYAVAFLDKYDVNVSYVYVDADVEMSKTFKMSERNDLVRRFKGKINAVESCESFDRNISWKCEFCQFKHICCPDNHGLEHSVINI